MGSLKDEMRGLREDHQVCEKPDDGERPGGSDGGSDGGTVPEGPQTNMSQESTTPGDYQPKLHLNDNYSEEGGTNPTIKDQVLSEGDSCNSDSIKVQVCAQTDTITLTQQAEGDKTTATSNSMTISNKFLNDEGEDAESQSENKSTSQDSKAEIENILVPVPSTPGPSNPLSPDLRSPAPFGQQHMRTQVSLEVVQCHSAATSPMTPPEGGYSFFFPSSFGKCGAVGTDTKDAELQVGQQVEFCSVATSPMTPKTPSTTAFPEFIGRDTVQKQESVKNNEKPSKSGQKESFPASKSSEESKSEINGALKFTSSKELTEGSGSNESPESSASFPAAESQVRTEDINQQCKQQRMGSMDQDITILVTHYVNNEEEEEEKTELSFYSIEPEMVKIDEYEELDENKSNREEKITAETAAQAQDISNSNTRHNKTEESSALASEQQQSDNSEVREKKDGFEDFKDVSVVKSPVPESPAPFGCHNIRTQVSLEVVQCQSAATSPMTPPEGDQAFCFPSSFGKCGAVGVETKDAESQVGQQVEFRSVATAPMTPRTPTTTTFPEIMKEASIKEKIVEEEEGKNEQVEDDKEEVLKEEEKVAEEKKVEAVEEEKKEAINCKEEKCEEPVQEVSWDEKGMTWEVYGAVVEVAVLGSAIQKHLEKQVKKQKRQPSMPPPPPLNPSATPLSAESTRGGSGSGKGRARKRGEQDGKVSRRRRNPFRLLMENMQQPHCCSRAHTTE